MLGPFRDSLRVFAPGAGETVAGRIHQVHQTINQLRELRAPRVNLP
jgi:hypothetical protein